MCGISGLFFFDAQRRVEEQLLEGMLDIASYRGPDDRGVYRCRNVGLAANRLSIIDLVGGRQPMANPSGTARIVFNGEIYNSAELRDQLIRRGHCFRTRCDTETILHAWDEYGEDCVNYLRGMFAFAICDEPRKMLFAARDRMGIKPFYYYVDEEIFAFASEIKSLLTIPSIPKEADTSALSDYLRHGYVIAPHTLFQGIRKLPPAHTITVRLDRIATRRYWEVPLELPRVMPEGQALEELETLLDETMRMHRISDVPLGVFLSGGIDSSGVVALSSRVGTENINTFSVGYDSAESELEYARIVAKHCRTDHHEIELTASAFADRFPNIVWHLDEPLADESAIPLYHLSQFARQKVTVVLSGEGADEIFGGYPMYSRMLTIDRVNQLPMMRFAGRAFERWAPSGKLRKNAAMLGRPLESRYRVAVIFPLDEIARLLPDQAEIDDPFRAFAHAYARCRDLDSLARMSYVDMNTWLPSCLLHKADRMTMAHSLELRVPFLDHKLVELTARLPLNLKIRGATRKYLLKQCMQPLLPSKIINRAKRGFPIPTKRWFREELRGFVREKLLASDSPCLNYFPRQEIARVLDAHRYRDCSGQIYALLVFDEWCRVFSRVRTSVHSQCHA